MVKIMENPIKMDDWGVPLFSETSMLHQVSLIFASKKTFCAEMRERVKGTLNSLAIVLPSPGPDNMTSNPPWCISFQVEAKSWDRSV